MSLPTLVTVQLLTVNILTVTQSFIYMCAFVSYVYITYHVGGTSNNVFVTFQITLIRFVFYLQIIRWQYSKLITFLMNTFSAWRILR